MTTTNTGSLALAGIRVVECGQGVAAAFATKLMALLGADVVKVEPPEGDITRRRGPFFDNAPDPNLSGLFLYLNADKSGVALDLREEGDRQRLDTLLARADILIHNIPPAERGGIGMDSDAVCGTHPRLIVAGISAFGERGPYSRYRAYEINAAHGSSLPVTGPGASPFPELPPLKLFGHQAEIQAGVQAAYTTLSAYFYRGDGGGQAIDISERACLAAMSESTLIYYTYNGKQASRLGKYGFGPRTVVPCADGWVHVNFLEDAQWNHLMELWGNPEWAHEEIFKDRYARGANADALDLMLSELTRQWKTVDLYLAAQARRIPIAPLNRASEAYADEQLRAREFFAPLPLPPSGPRVVEAPTAPFKSNRMGFRLERPAPELGQHNREIFSDEKSGVVSSSNPRAAAPIDLEPTNTGPLSGIRVLDFSWVWAGPYCTQQLAYLGAEVIRIESSKRLCATRCLPPFLGDKPGPNRAGPFNQWNQNKLSLELNLSRGEAVEIACELARHCDVAVENFAPGVIDRMGLGYDVLRRHQPDLIMISMSGYGRTGPHSGFVNYGPQLGAQSGLLSVTGYPGDRPREAAIAYSDPASGMFATYLVTAALIHRARTGEGQYMDLSMLEVLEMFQPEMLLEYAMTGRNAGFIGNRDRVMSPHNCYKALGDAEAWVTIAVGSETEWRALCAAMGQPSLADDPRFASAELRKRNEDALDRIISDSTARRDRWETTEMLQRAGVAAFPTLNNKDIAHDPNLRERGFLVELNHSEGGKLTEPGVPWTMSATPCRVRRAAPTLGMDTEDVLTRLLGYSTEKIAALRAAQIVI